MKLKQRLFSILLVLTLVLSFMPAMAFADEYDGGDGDYGDGEYSETMYLYEIFSLDIDQPYRMYTDGDLTLNLDVRLQDEEIAPYLQYTYELGYAKCDENGNAVEEDLVMLENDGDKYFTVDGTRITLHGKAIRACIPEEDISETPYDIRFDVTASDSSGKYEAVCGTQSWIRLADPFEEYNLDVGRELILGSPQGYDKVKEGYAYGTGLPEDGESFDFNVTAVVSSNESVLKIGYDKDYDEFVFNPVSKGTADVTVTYIDRHGAKQTEIIAVKVTDAIYSVEFDEKFYDNKFVLPGGSITVKVNATKETADGDAAVDDCDYDWIVDSEKAGSVTVTEDPDQPGTATLTFAPYDTSTDDEENEYDVYLNVQLVKDGEVVAETGREDIDVRCSYYTVSGFPQSEYYLGLNKSVKFAPTIKEVSIENPSGVDVTDKLFTMLDFDEDLFSVKDQSGNVIHPGDVFKGPFTATRIAEYEGELYVDWGNQETADEEFNYCAGRQLEVGELMDIADYSKVNNIADQVYTGKALTPAPVVNEYDPEEDEAYGPLKKGTDYTVSYKNNKNVGKATVTITGTGRYYGKVTKTFKINPKPATLSKLKAGKKSMTVTWKKQATQTTGYQIQYSLKSNFKGAKTVTIKKNSTVKTTIKKLKAKNKYYVRIRTYKKVGSANYYSKWSKAKSVKVK